MQLSRLPGLLIFCLALFIGIAQPLQHNRPQWLGQYLEADFLYMEGERIVNRPDYSEEKETRLNEDALKAFRTLQKSMSSSHESYDSLSFFVHFKIGVLEHYFDNPAEAKIAYSKAIELKQSQPSIPDSFLFKPYLYFGIILYNENLFDSSLAIYKKAEAIAASYSTPLQETERLFNTLGALYYETGNYRQAKNYTEKSLAIISPANPYYRDLVVNYKINLASILTRLEEYDEANHIYQEILPLDINRDIILHNTGVINLKLGSVNKALSYFRKVNYTDNRRSRLYNDMALAYMNTGKNDSAHIYLQKAREADSNPKRKTVVKGQTEQYHGDLLLEENKISEALAHYQQAIINYYPAYGETDIFKNPVQFSGVFSYINLFNTLTAKGEAFEKLFYREKDKGLLKAALDTYRSAFKLAEYVERSYDSDEARLFLNRIKYGVHSRPIDISLLLYDETGDKTFLEEAWQFDQMNKASILSFNINVNEIKTTAEFNRQEKEIKSVITRLSLRAAQEADSNRIQELNATIRDYEIELGKVQEIIAASGDYKALHRNIPTVSRLQRSVLDKHTALLSYHLSEKELLILCITQKKYFYKKIPSPPVFYSSIDSLVKALHNVNSDEKFSAGNIAERLYAWLIKPVDSGLASVDRLIIIPDDELNYLPFETLLDENGRWLTENFTVQYQYTASLLEKRKKKYAAAGVLSFAPFANAGTDDFSRLNYSAEEIKDLGGKQYFDNTATKKQFLLAANSFPVIHLATHARVNDKLPFQSFIAFAGGNNSDSVVSRLYTEEIYNLALDSTRLVILSACETGAGQLVHGEGMMSLSRAFAYAGCPDIVTSLWKAEDKTTAFLTRRLHFYLSEKLSADKALHLAKLDLLKSSEIEERLKTPNYWAHLIFIGAYEPGRQPFFKWWYAIPFLLITGTWIFFRRRKKIHKTISSS